MYDLQRLISLFLSLVNIGRTNVYLNKPTFWTSTCWLYCFKISVNQVLITFIKNIHNRLNKRLRKK